MINQRRIDIHISSVISVDVYDKLKYPSLAACERSKLKSERVKASCVIASALTKIEFDEEPALPSGSPPVKRIISYTAFPVLTEVKVIRDKALINCEVNLSVLYTADNAEESVERCDYTFAASKIIDVNGISDNDIPIVKLRLGSLFVKTKSSAGEGINSFNVFGELSAHCVFIRQFENTYISDGYIPGYKCDCSYDDYKYCTEGAYTSESRTVNSAVAVPDGIKEDLELSVDISDEKAKNGKLSAKLSLYAVCRDGSGSLIGVSAGDVLEIPLGAYGSAFAAININSYDYTISSDNTIDVRINVGVNIFAYDCISVKTLGDINAAEKENLPPALTVYYGKGSERVWDIAKRFSSDEELIKAENGIKGDYTENDGIIIVPRA
ncbi:MAG: DUF3794 domain-containing protein [Eubacterium sp.]|nr:DUF3794 domain-containing protein [Eubacterium sp.]